MKNLFLIALAALALTLSACEGRRRITDGGELNCDDLANHALEACIAKAN